MLKQVSKILEDVDNCTQCDNIRGAEYYNDKIDQRFMLILQNPGTTPEKDKELKGSTSIKDKFLIWRKFFKQWSLDSRMIRFQKILQLMKKYRLINFPSLDDYINSEQLFDDFYFTDVIKCYGTKEEGLDARFEPCVNYFLKKELEIFASGPQFPRKLIIAVGNYAFNALLKFKQVPKSISVTQQHGYLFTITIGGNILYFIPIAHFARRQVYLRNSYFEYFEQGIQKFLELERIL